MKKVIFALAAVVALAACSQEDVIVADKGAAIGFDTFVENSTRSVYDPSYTNDKLFANFGVFGTVEGAELFNNKTVTGSEIKGTWAYEGTQYWIAGAKYNFAAVAPKTVKVNDVDTDVYTNASYAVTSSEVEGKTVYTGTTTLSFANNGKIDLLYAEATAEGKAGSGDAEKPANAKVGFNFRHVLSKVKFSFENAYNATNATIRVENVKIHDAYASGSVVLDDETVWTPVTTGDMLELDFGKATDNAATTDVKEAVDVAFECGKTYESHNELLMIPGQGASTYTVTNADNTTTTEYKDVYKVTFDVVLLVSGKVIDTYEHTIYTTFAPVAGMRYNLKAVIDATNIDPAHAQEPIEFTVNKIKDWDAETTVKLN
ncbi:MAG: fimbrillin family protein [Alistipes sp.]|nr:fimbrillin family protein [Alistipes sp.]MBR5771204.1 fimbrillin family protein [Alistipes sp.]